MEAVADRMSASALAFILGSHPTDLILGYCMDRGSGRGRIRLLDDGTEGNGGGTGLRCSGDVVREEARSSKEDCGELSMDLYRPGCLGGTARGREGLCWWTGTVPLISC